MSAGVIFLVVIVIVLAAILGGALYALSAWLRGRKLSPEGDKLEGETGEPPRPEHARVENEQRSRFVGSR